jgi:hypothetical protein
MMSSFGAARQVDGRPILKGSEKTGSGRAPSGAGWRAENIERTPRVPSMSCRSVTSDRSFSTGVRSSKLSPVTTIIT